MVNGWEEGELRSREMRSRDEESLSPTAVYWNNGKTVTAFSERSFECTLQALRHFDTTLSAPPVG